MNLPDDGVGANKLATLCPGSSVHTLNFRSTFATCLRLAANGAVHMLIPSVTGILRRCDIGVSREENVFTGYGVLWSII